MQNAKLSISNEQSIALSCEEFTGQATTQQHKNSPHSPHSTHSMFYGTNLRKFTGQATTQGHAHHYLHYVELDRGAAIMYKKDRDPVKARARRFEDFYFIVFHIFNKLFENNYRYFLSFPAKSGNWCTTRYCGPCFGRTNRFRRRHDRPGGALEKPAGALISISTNFGGSTTRRLFTRGKRTCW